MKFGIFRYTLKKTFIKPFISVKLLLFVFALIVLTGLNVQSAFGQSNDDCLACHEDNELTMEKNGREVSLYVNPGVLSRSTHNKLTCVSCHTGFDPDDLPHKENILPIDCKSCHKDAGVKHQFHPQMLRTTGSNGSRDVSCKNCHGTHDVISPSAAGSKWNRNNLSESCGSCHKEIGEKYVHSQHAIAFREGVKGAPNCLTCHKHQIAHVSAKRDTLQLKIAQEKFCLSCHLDDPDIRARTSPSAGFIMQYEKSVHGSSLNAGNAKAANCVDCHTSHEVKSGFDRTSTVNKSQIPFTCANCHEDISKDYQESIHWAAVLRGSKESPVCTDCHGEHNILRHDDPRSPVAFGNVSKQICTPCHSSLKLSEKYGIATDRYQTFSDSYHGLALRGGSVEVANCASCHGIHNIKPSSDPTSTVHKDNIVKTCGSCHPGANENFAIGRIHVTYDKEEEPLLYWVATLYISLIITLIGGMFLHNFIDFYRKAKIKKLRQRGLMPEESHGHALYLRMTVNERIQHLIMMISFIILVITGFMLRFPDAWWVRHIRDLSEYTFEIRSLLHRTAAVAMVSVSLYHVFYLTFTKRGKQLLKDLLPRYQDILDAVGVAKFNLGISKVKPKLDRFSYVEKAEYWALVWGTIIMSATGFILWFDNTFIGLLTKLGWDVARTIHYYEAWLAFLAIIVWHIYFVIFNPDVYPMNLAWIKGTLTEEEMAHEHPKELERIKKKQVQSKIEIEEKDDQQIN
jgi:cytochrome b subunit of formate dehydrogenase